MIKGFDKTSVSYFKDCSLWQSAFWPNNEFCGRKGQFFCRFPYIEWRAQGTEMLGKTIRTACRIRSRIRGHREGDLNNGRAESRAEVQNPGKWNIAFGYWTNKKYSGGNDRARLLETVTRAAVLSYSSDRFSANGEQPKVSAQLGWNYLIRRVVRN